MSGTIAADVVRSRMLKIARPSALRTAMDSRSDDGRRTIQITPQTVVIERHVGGVKMRIAVPMSAYASALLAQRAMPATDYAIVLTHADPELSVEIDAAADLDVLASRLVDWARYLGKPAEIAGGPARAATARAPARAARRAAILLRRKGGTPARMAVVFRGEVEMIARDLR